MQHQLEADMDKVKSNLGDQIVEAVTKEAKDRQGDIAKLNKDLDDLHEASLKEIRAVSGDLHAKVGHSTSKSGLIFVCTIFVQNSKCSPILKLIPTL